METNNLTYKVTKTKGGIVYDIVIKLNDECKNGHQDFSITGTSYPAGKPKTDRNMLGCGAMGGEIAEKFPEFEIFNRLHSCDYLGAPIHAVANMYYHIKSGFNSTPANDPKFSAEFCKYYRITTKQFDVLRGAHSQTHFAILLVESHVPQSWKIDANKGIAELERLTGKTFVIDSKRSQLSLPDVEKLDTEKEKIANGYYSDTEREKRIKAQKDAFVQSLKQKASADKDKIDLELEIKIELYRIGGVRLFENVIFYNHNQTLGFNWRGYGEKIEESEVLHILENSPLLAQFKYTIK